MTKRYGRKIFGSIFILLFCVMFTGKSNIVKADQGETIFVSSTQIAKAGGSAAIQSALNKAREKATEHVPYTVKVEPGTYKVTTALRIYSNTTIDLTDVTLVRTEDTNVIRTGLTDSYDSVKGITGYHYKNISVIGGVFDGAMYSATMIKFAHAKNVSMDGVEIKNDYNAHEMEVAGIDGLYINNCIFKDQIIDNTVSTLCKEAIQIDILCSNHLKGYRSEPIETKNVKITNCTFENVPRGIGSHTAILNRPFDNIEITNCKFKDIPSVAIQSLYWTNCNISDNVIENAARGIVMYFSRNKGRGTYLASYLDNEGKMNSGVSEEYIAYDDQNINICNNTVSLNNEEDAYSTFTKAAIMVAGADIQEQAEFSDNSGNLPFGNYYASGVKISENNITTGGHGIYVSDTKNCIVDKNTVVGRLIDDFAYDKSTTGIYILGESENVSITDNNVSYMTANGIYIKGKSKTEAVSGNEVSECDSRGIIFNGSSSCNGAICNNTVSGSGLEGIRISNAKVNDVYGNKVSGTENGEGINITSKAKAKNIYSNEICDTGVKEELDFYAGISVNTSSKVTSIKLNTISETGHGIYVTGSSQVTKNISDNKVSNVGGAGINVENYSVVSGYISKNTITGTDGAGIMIFDNAKVAGELKTNTISQSKQYGILLKNSSTTGKIYSNKVKENELGGIYVNNMAYVVDGIEKNTVSDCYGNGISVSDEGHVEGNIDGNVVKSIIGTGIIVSFYSYIDGDICNNKISDVENKGIYIYDLENQCSVEAIQYNTISETLSQGINVTSAKYDMTISDNVLNNMNDNSIIVQTGNSYAYIYVNDNNIYGNKNFTGVRAISGNVMVANNKIKNVSRGVYANKGVGGKISVNDYSKNYYCNVCAAVKGKEYLFSQSGINIKKSESDTNSITIRWKKASVASGYWLQYSTKKDFSSDVKEIDINKNVGGKVIKGLKKNKKYYFRIRTYKICNGKLSVYSRYGSTFMAKTLKKKEEKKEEKAE